MINISDIKNSILNLAIRGKLVGQNQSEGNAKDLLESLKNDKLSLINQGLIKKDKIKNVKEDDFYFDLPNNWVWAKLIDVASVNGGYAFKSEDYQENGIRIIRISDFNENGFINDKVVRQEYREELAQFLLNEKDILLCMTGGTVGKSYFVTHLDEKMVVNQRVATIKIINPCKEYINYVILSPLIQDIIQFTKNSTNDNISIDTINSFPIPLPPLEEQKRIVKQLNMIFDELNKIEVNQQRIEDTKEKLQKLILDYAVKGKLIEQKIDEGSGQELFDKIINEKQRLIGEKKLKKNKPLPEINEDEIPFQIPSNWKWCRIIDVCYKIFAGGDKPSDFVLTKDSNHQIPVVANGVKNDGILGYTSVATANKNSITIAGRGTIGFSVYRTYDFCPIVRLVVLEQSKLINPQFLQYVLSSLTETGNGTSIPQLTVPMLSPKLIPLPPRMEQDRIVDKVEGLLSVLNKMI